MFDLPTSRIALDTGLATRLFDSGGDGPPVILLHGLGLSLDIWGKVIPALTPSHRVIAFDFPGYGAADRPDAAYDGGFFAEQVRAVMDALSLPDAILVGSSLGASTVVRFSVENLHRIRRAVLMAPGGFGQAAHLVLRAPTLPVIGFALGKPTWLSNAYALRLSMADPAFATHELIDLAADFAKRPGSHVAFVRTVTTGLGPFGVKGTDSFAEAARAFNRPVLVLWGRQDRVFPVRQAQTAGGLLPDVRVEIIDRCGHYPQWEAPERFSREVLEFLQL
jgi:pimeloyl-ACP methyl ester carboxylesterase